MRRVWILVPAALLLSACGGSSSESEAPSSGTGPPLQTISLSEQEFSITPKSINVAKAGTYSFAVKNEGQITHALEVEGNGVEQKTGDIDPGKSATLTIDLAKKGSYEVYCPIDGHRQNGMEASLTVGGGAAGGMSTEDHETTTGQTSTQKKGGYGY
jgi:uncharacterized cupredoxin-like copper-binding protein